MALTNHMTLKPTGSRVTCLHHFTCPLLLDSSPGPTTGCLRDSRQALSFLWPPEMKRTHLFGRAAVKMTKGLPKALSTMPSPPQRSLIHVLSLAPYKIMGMSSKAKPSPQLKPGQQIWQRPARGEAFSNVLGNFSCVSLGGGA